MNLDDSGSRSERVAGKKKLPSIWSVAYFAPLFPSSGLSPLFAPTAPTLMRHLSCMKEHDRDEKQKVATDGYSPQGRPTHRVSRAWYEGVRRHAAII